MCSLEYFALMAKSERMSELKLNHKEQGEEKVEFNDFQKNWEYNLGNGI